MDNNDIKEATKEVTEYVYEKVINKLGERPEKIQNLINKYGNNKIIEMSICRTPIELFYKILLHLTTWASIYDIQKKYNYDDIFHLHIDIKLDNGLVIGMEKNERIKLVKDGIPQTNKTDCHTLNTSSKNIIVNSFFVNGEHNGGDNFYRYNPYKDNCQKWIHDLLSGSGIRSLDKFVLQNVDDIVEKDFRGVSKKLIDLYSIYKYYTEKDTDI